MNDSLLDDVKALLDKDFGDDRILKQISRACENNEVISNYERNYVQKLAEKYLGKRPEITHMSSVEKKPITPDVVIPETQPIQVQRHRPEISLTSKSNSKNSKILIGIVGIALIIIIAVAVSFSGISNVSPKVETPINSIPVTLSIQSDLSSYNKQDLISISGVSDTSGTVNLSIENTNKELVWTEQVSIKSNGQYSTLAIAGGQGWESSGTYTIKVDNGKETKSTIFSFKS